MTTPLITIFVRHAADCKYAGDEFCKRCNCRKHLRWTQDGKQFRRKAGTRSWQEAEERKRQLEDELTGRAPAETEDARMPVSTAIEKFMQAKRNDGLEEPTLQKLQMTCDRVLEFAEADGLFVLDSITLVHLTNWKWDRYFGTVNSLRANQEHKNWRNFSRRHARIHQDHGKKLCEMGEGRQRRLDSPLIETWTQEQAQVD